MNVSRKKLFLYALPVLSGTLTGLALTTTYSFLGFFSLVPLLEFIYLADCRRSILLGSWLYGVVLWGFLVQWIFKFLPLDWAGFSPTSAVFFVSFSWALTALFLGLATIPFGFAAKKLFSKNPLPLLFLGAALWVTIEYCSSWLLMLLWYGPGGRIMPITLGHIGYALADFPPLLRLASFGSIYLLSGVLFLFNAVLFLLLKTYFHPDRRGQTLRTLIVSIAIFLGMTGFTLAVRITHQVNSDNISSAPMKVALVASNIPSWAEANPAEKAQIKKKVTSFLKTLARENTDVIIFPESARVSNVVDYTLIKNLFSGKKTILIDNALGTNTESRKLSSLLVVKDLGSNTDVAGWSKSQLFMAGEYPPYILLGFARALGLEDIARRYEKNSYARGERQERPVKIKESLLSISLCTQVWAPQFFRQQKKLGANILANMSSDALFHGSKSYYLERLAMLKVRAVENKSYLFHASNASPSLVVNPAGEIIRHIETKDPIGYTYGIIQLP